MVIPPSQKAGERPIAFFLDDGVQGTLFEYVLVIRPEDLTHQEPALQTPTQTFGGAFVDDFGPGLRRLQIAGHTGWKTGTGWENEFETLHDVVWRQYHESRREAVKRGLSPNIVKLIFVDKLDNLTAVVAPGQFSLKRSRARPLLKQYQIEMTVIADRISDKVVDPLDFSITSSAKAAEKQVAGVASLSSSFKFITGAAANLRGFIDAAFASPVRAFMETSAESMTRVLAQPEIAGGLAGIYTAETDQLIDVAADLAMVGRNIFYTYNTVTGLTDAVQHNTSRIASAYENAYCVLRNSLRSVRRYQDYSDVYGASVCSSTVGGSPLSPLAGENAFEVIIPTVALPPRIGADARNAMSTMMASDAVLQPLSMGDAARMAQVIANGVTYER